MTDDKLPRLSRRRVLGTMGALGAGAALGGAGTSAFFSDEETFKNNRLVAGSLDLKVDWEEHLVDWMDGPLTSEASVEGVRMVDSAADVGSDEIGIPDAENPLLAVKTVDTDGDQVPQIAEFMNASSIEAYPDTNDDGVQDPNPMLPEYPACENLADTPEDLHPEQGKALRTNNSDTVTYDETGAIESVKPLVALDDVKPGDFGELTLSFHLCDNPGYIWLNGQLVSESENGVTEPEASDPDEGPGVELTDEIQTMLWYDEDGDNVYEPGGVSGEADIALVLDDSGSMTGGKLTQAKNAAINLIDTVGSNAKISVIGFDTNPSMEQVLTDDKQAARDAVNGLSAGGFTNIEEAIDMAHEELDGHDVHSTYTASGGHRSGAKKIVVLLTDGFPNEGYESTGDTPPSHEDDSVIFNSDYGEDNPADNADYLTGSGHDVTMYTVGLGISETSTEAELLEYMATDDGQSFIGAQTELFDIFSQIAQQIAGEEAFFRGSLRELLDELSSGNGIPLDGNRTTPFDELADDPGAATRECFVSSTTNAVGLAWWLPVDHGNEVQTDSVAFDLGFYTEQCRHNEGSGMTAPIPTRQGSGFAKLSEDTNQSAGYGQDGENFNGDESTSGGARARYGNNDPADPGELYVGDEPGTSGEFNEANDVWTSGETVDWEVNYDESTDELEFVFDGTSVSDTLDDPQPDGRVAIQGKADEGTVEGSIEELVIGGEAHDLSGSNTITATNDGDGRDIQYLVVNTALDGETSFTISGTATVTLQGDYGGGQEGVAFDVVFE